MSGARVGRRRSPAAEPAEVEEMLRAAEDELLMELHTDAHTISSSSSLDPDLARRFEALKSPRLPHRKPSQTIPSPQSSTPLPKVLEISDQIHVDTPDDDLMARFAALKGPTRNLQPVADLMSNRVDSSSDEEVDDGDGGDKVSKKEVDKVMQWAIDAARLDPSRSEDEDSDIDKENGEDELESEIEEKKRDKDKGKSIKWFSLFR